MSTEGGATTGSVSQLSGSSNHCRSTRESSHSNSSHNQYTRNKKGVAPRSMIDTQHKRRIAPQSPASVRRKGSESSSRFSGRTSSSSYARDHHIWTEKEVKEFYTTLVGWGSLQFKRISSVLQPDEEGSGIRFKNKWNGEKKRAINRGPVSDCRALVVSVINDYIVLLSDTPSGPNLSQEERERLASWITDLVAALPLDTNKNTSSQVTGYIAEVYNRFFNYRNKLDMLRCLYIEGALAQQLNHVVLGHTQTSQPIVANSMQLPASLSVPISPPLQTQPTISTLGQLGATVESQQHQILAGVPSYFNVGLQNPVQQALVNQAPHVLVQQIWPYTTEGISIQNPCLLQSGNGVLLPQDLSTLSSSDLVAQLRTILGMPQYSEIAQMPFNLNHPEGREAVIKAIIEQNERMNVQLRQQLVSVPVAAQNVVYQHVYQQLPQFVSLSSPVLSTIAYADAETAPQLAVCLANTQGGVDLNTVNAVAIGSSSQAQITCELVPVRPVITTPITSLSSETISSCVTDQRPADTVGLESRMRNADPLISSASPIPSVDGSFSSKDTPVEISDSGRIRPFIPTPLESTGPSFP